MRISIYSPEEITYDRWKVGISLGYDYCSEHENGIQGLNSRFGVDTDAAGLKSRAVTRTPSALTWVAQRTSDGGTYAGFSTSKLNFYYTELLEMSLARHDYASCWDENDLCVVSKTDEGIDHLQEIYLALSKGAGVLLTKGGRDSGNPFGGSGPCLIILRPELKEAWEDLDTELIQAQQLQAKWESEWAIETVGLYEAIQNMNSNVSKHLGQTPYSPFYYLPIRRPDSTWVDRPRVNNHSPKRVWLNPSCQSFWNHGWFTSSNLFAWTRGEGPVWPTFLGLPGLEHPIWDDFHRLFDRKPRDYWGGPPFNKERATYDGWEFWHHADVGVHPADTKSVRGPYHKLWSPDLEVAQARGLTTQMHVSDRKKIEDFLVGWLADNPDHGFKPFFYGSGTERLKAICQPV